MIVILKGESGNLAVTNVHIKPSDGNEFKKSFFREIASAQPALDSSHNLICGDFNLCCYDEGVFNFASSTYSYHTRPLAQAWNNIFAQYSDISSDQFTHCTRSASGQAIDASRIDRVYTSLPPPILHDVGLTCCTLYPATAPNPTSDHVPFSVTFSHDVHPPPGPRPVPARISNHPAFAGAVDEPLTNWGYNDEMELAERREAIHAVFSGVAEELKSKTIVGDSSSCDERLAWAISAMRSWHNIIESKLTRALEAFKDLRKFFSHDPSSPAFPFHLTSPQAFFELISTLAAKTYEDRVQELQDNPTLSAMEISRRRASLLKWAQRFTCKGKKVRLNAILDDNDHPFDSVEDEVAALIAKWQPVFGQRPIELDTAVTISSSTVQVPEINWLLSFDEFCTLLDRTRNSAPGPDGLVYGCWKKGGNRVRKYLYHIYVNTFYGGELPLDFNFALFVLFPKTHKVRTLRSTVKLATSDLSPLATLSERYWRVLSTPRLLLLLKPLAFPTNGVVLQAGSWLTTSSRLKPMANLWPGFLRRSPVFFFFDLSFAFPSINWCYLFLNPF